MNHRPSIQTWPLNWQLIRYRPGTFTFHSACVIALFVLQVGPGLVEKTIFDTITGAVPAALNLWWLIALYASVELARLAITLGVEWSGWTFRYVVGALLRRNLLASILHRSGDNALPVSSGEAINRFRNDVAEVSDFPTWLPDI